MPAVGPRDLRAWPITPTSIDRAPHGFNNETYFVDAREGQFVLRVYRSTAEVGRVHDEHDLLGALALQELPFAVPTPMPTREGDTVAVLEGADGPRLATLFTRIPGSPAEKTPRHARLGGRALAQVDLVLARLDRPVRAPVRIRDVHPLVDDPIAALDELDLGERSVVARGLLERVDESHDALAGALPWQIIHGDFAFPNVLIDQNVVTGFLDFEFAAPDMRAADLATALHVACVSSTAEERWPLLEALIAGYGRSIPLDPAEAAAMPDLMRRRSAIGVVHWIAKFRQSVGSRQDVVDRIDRGIALSQWLDENAVRIAATALGTPNARTPRKSAR